MNLLHEFRNIVFSIQNILALVSAKHELNLYKNPSITKFSRAVLESVLISVSSNKFMITSSFSENYFQVYQPPFSAHLPGFRQSEPSRLSTASAPNLSRDLYLPPSPCPGTKPPTNIAPAPTAVQRTRQKIARPQIRFGDAPEPRREGEDSR